MVSVSGIVGVDVEFNADFHSSHSLESFGQNSSYFITQLTLEKLFLQIEITSYVFRHRW